MTPELATSTAPVITQTMIIGFGILMVRDIVWKGIGLRKAGNN